VVLERGINISSDFLYTLRGLLTTFVDDLVDTLCATLGAKQHVGCVPLLIQPRVRVTTIRENPLSLGRGPSGIMP
jgi:hypothetical protein